MNESLYVGAYWKARAESIDACADRMWLLLTRINEISPLFKLWYPKKKTAQETIASPLKTKDEIQAMLSKGRNRRDDNDQIIEQLGFNLGIWNGEEDEVKSLDIRTHLGGTSAWVKNNLVVRLPRGQHHLTKEQTQTLFKLIIAVSDPEYATVSSHQCRGKLQVKKEFTFGWMGYVKAKIKGPGTARVSIEPFGKGTILGVNAERFSSADEQHLTAAKELNDIVRHAGLMPT